MTTTLVGPWPIVLCQIIFPPGLALPADRPTAFTNSIGDSGVRQCLRRNAPDARSLGYRRRHTSAFEAARLLLVGRREHFPAGSHAVDCCRNADIGRQLHHDLDEFLSRDAAPQGP